MADYWPPRICTTSEQCRHCKAAGQAVPRLEIVCPLRIIYRKIYEELQPLFQAAHLLVKHVRIVNRHLVWCKSDRNQAEARQNCGCKIWQTPQPQHKVPLTADDLETACVCLDCLESIIKHADVLQRHLPNVDEVWRYSQPLRTDRDDQSSLPASVEQEFEDVDYDLGSDLEFCLSIITVHGSGDTMPQPDDRNSTYRSSNVRSQAAVRLAEFQDVQSRESQERFTSQLSEYARRVNKAPETKVTPPHPVANSRRKSFSSRVQETKEKWARRRASSLLSHSFGADEEKGDSISSTRSDSESLLHLAEAISSLSLGPSLSSTR